MNKYTFRALALANRMSPGPNGGRWELEHIQGCVVGSDACSGGLSLFYKLVMRQNISCHHCCLLHDFLYSVGGTAGQRQEADLLLRECAASAGYLPSGWRGYARRAWRGFRAWVMYAAVRVFGGLYWSTE